MKTESRHDNSLTQVRHVQSNRKIMNSFVIGCPLKRNQGQSPSQRVARASVETGSSPDVTRAMLTIDAVRAIAAGSGGDCNAPLRPVSSTV